MASRMQITMEPELRRRAQAKAADKGISIAEYMRRLVANDLGEPLPKADISIIFDLVTDGPVTDIARDKDKMIGEAVWKEHLRKTGQSKRQPPPENSARRRR